MNFFQYKVSFHSAKNFTFNINSSRILHIAKSKLANWVLKEKDISVSEHEANQIRQAEVLIPYKIPSTYIKGIYVPNEKIKNKVTEIFQHPEKVVIHSSLFFEDNRKWHELDSVSAEDLSDTGVESYNATSSYESENSSDVDDLEEHLDSMKM